MRVTRSMVSVPLLLGTLFSVEGFLLLDRTRDTTKPYTGLCLTPPASSASSAEKQNPASLQSLPVAPILDDIPSQFQPLFRAIVNATLLRPAETSAQAHDSFRYEWGTWVQESNLEHLMKLLDDTVRIIPSVHPELLPTAPESTSSPTLPQQATPLCFRIGNGEYWDCLLHILPEQSSHTGRHSAGSWTVLHPLMGQVEICSVSGPNAQGYYTPRGTKRKLRGVGDGNKLGASRSSRGESCIKYVGGPLRQYRAEYGTSILLEITVRPPIRLELDTSHVQPLPLSLEKVLSIVDPEPEIKDGIENQMPPKPVELSNLTSSMGMSFENVGGLDSQLQDIARRVLASRANPKLARSLGISHVKGILLSGPPGCG